jgi:hypothetical protein
MSQGSDEASGVKADKDRDCASVLTAMEIRGWFRYNDDT